MSCLQLCEVYACQFLDSLRAEASSVFVGETRQLAMVNSCLDDLNQIVEKVKRLNQVALLQLSGNPLYAPLLYQLEFLMY